MIVSWLKFDWWTKYEWLTKWVIDYVNDWLILMAARKKKFKLQSVSVGDCIHEQGSAESASNGGSHRDHMSIRSLTSDVATSHMDLTPPNAKAHPISPSLIKGMYLAATYCSLLRSTY